MLRRTDEISFKYVCSTIGGSFLVFYIPKCSFLDFVYKYCLRFPFFKRRRRLFYTNEEEAKSSSKSRRVAACSRYFSANKRERERERERAQ